MEKTTRERLTGAVIFVAIVAIVAPEMFSGRGDDAPKPAEAAPAEAGPPLATYDLPINPSTAPAPAPAPAPAREAPAAVVPDAIIAQAVTPPDTTSASAQPAPPPAATPAPAPAPAPPAASVAATPATGGWWVQLGSFASEQNAQRLARDLRAKGFDIEVARVKAGGVDMHRVRAGPARDRAAATELKDRIGSSARDAKLIGP